MGREACSFTPSPAHMRGWPPALTQLMNGRRTRPGRAWDDPLDRLRITVARPGRAGDGPWVVMHLPTGADAPQKRGWSLLDAIVTHHVPVSPAGAGMVPGPAHAKTSRSRKPRRTGTGQATAPGSPTPKSRKAPNQPGMNPPRLSLSASPERTGPGPPGMAHCPQAMNAPYW